MSFLDGADRNLVALTDATEPYHLHLSTGLLGKPGVGTPTIVVQDNTKMLAFTVNTDAFFYDWEIPDDYAGGDLKISFEWTNDGGVDDNGKNVKCQIDYQVYSDGGSIAGSHANSPKSIDDTYTSASGWITHATADMTIAEADFAGEHEISLKGSFVTALATVLTGEPHLLSVTITYTRYVNQ